MMKTASILMVFASLVLYAQDPPDIESMKQGQPEDVATYVSRAFECWHWGGEEPYSTARAQEIDEAMAKLRCDDLALDEAKLRLKYLSNPPILKILDNTKSFN